MPRAPVQAPWNNQQPANGTSSASKLRPEALGAPHLPEPHIPDLVVVGEEEEEEEEVHKPGPPKAVTEQSSRCCFWKKRDGVWGGGQGGGQDGIKYPGQNPP